ncbi:MAG: PssE/Cps14G family polysaccharide biosynthesis glycosyltransferase [Bacilli bacterium]
MILILLGTQDDPFTRILDAIVENVKNGKIKDHVIAQIGSTKYDSTLIETFDFLPQKELNKYVEAANVIITHGGVGTIIECLKMNKKIIAVPRLKKYGEHTNDHQLQIIAEFTDRKYVIPLYNVDEINDCLKKTESFIPRKYVSNKSKFAKSIKDIIDME